MSKGLNTVSAYPYSMRKIILAILMLIIVIGCAPTTPVEPTDSTPDVKEVEERIDQVEEKLTTVEKKMEEKEPEEATVIVEKQQEPIAESVVESKDAPAAPSIVKEKELSTEIEPRMKDLLTRADKKVKSFSYLLAPPPDQLGRNKWYVKGSQIRVELYDDNYVEPEIYYDNIFIDTIKKTAVGVCVSQRTARCAKPGQEFTQDYGDTMVKTPYQWLKSIKGTPKIISTELLYDRKVDVVEYKDGSDTVTQWVDQFSGLTVRVQIGDDKRTRTEFRLPSNQQRN